MFVLCPHCHFLVGIDPRTGKPPAACPKCGGVVVEPLPETHAEEILAPAPLAPFAPVELPSVLPTLPEPESEPVSAAAEPITPVPAAAPAIASAAAIETPAAPRAGWWSRRRPGPSTAPTPSSAAPVEPPAAPAPAPAQPPAPTGVRATPAEPVDPQRANAMIAAIQGRRRTSRKSAAPPPPAIEPPKVVTAVEADTAPARIEEAATTSTTIDMPVETRHATPVKRPRQAPAPANATDAAPATAPEPVAVAATVIPPVVAPPPMVDAPPVGIVSADAVVPPHPLRRRTDFDANATAEPVAGVPPTHPLRRRTDAPSFIRPRVRASAASRIGWRSLATVGGLCLLLALQLLLAQRDTLAASARWRSTIAAVCTTLRCSLPSWHEPSAFTMLSRDVRPHPNAPGTLLINASFRNDARWPQPWPRLVLTLSDLDGRMVGARSFAAGEYLGSTPTQSELAPGQTAAVAMSVVEPAPNIVAFTFDFR